MGKVKKWGNLLCIVPHLGAEIHISTGVMPSIRTSHTALILPEQESRLNLISNQVCAVCSPHRGYPQRSPVPLSRAKCSQAPCPVTTWSQIFLSGEEQKLGNILQIFCRLRHHFVLTCNNNNRFYFRKVIGSTWLTQFTCNRALSCFLSFLELSHVVRTVSISSELVQKRDQLKIYPTLHRCILGTIIIEIKGRFQKEKEKKVWNFP